MNHFNGQQAQQQPINQQQQMSLQIIQLQLANMTPEQQQALLRQHPQLAAFLHHYQQQRLQQQMMNHQQQQQQQGQQPSMMMPTGDINSINGIPNGISVGGLPPQQALKLQQKKKRPTKKELKAQVAGVLPGVGVPPNQMPMNAMNPHLNGPPPHHTPQIYNPQLQQQQQQQQLPQVQQPIVPPQAQIPTESVLPLVKIDPSSYWSNKLKEEGKKEIPSEVLLYEQITKRDLDDSRRIANNGNAEQHASLAKKMGSELKYYENLRTIRSQSIDPKFPNIKSIWGEGYQGYGNGSSDTGRPTQLIYPNQAKKFSRIPDQYIPPAANYANAEQQEQLVPIRLEFDLEKDKFKLSDTFVWNNNEKLITLERFVSMLMEDYQFKNPLYTNTVLQSVKEQLSEYLPIVSNPSSRSIPLQDIRIPIKLDITIANNQLVDQFEWDLTNTDNNPEEFASVMVAELSLSTEFVSLIAHSIREQCQMFVKALYTTGYQFDGTPVEEEEIKRFLVPNIQTGYVKRQKNSLSVYTPSVMEINSNELERLDKDKERESRRKRRTQGRTSTRRGGPTLPDLADYPKTIRTVVPNSVLPGGVDLTKNTFQFSETVERVIVPEDQFIKQQSVQSPLFKREERRTNSVFYRNLGNQFLVTIKLQR